ncbi:MAG: S49 family peptidase [Alphaproteobacteria bacterium]
MTERSASPKSRSRLSRWLARVPLLGRGVARRRAGAVAVLRLNGVIGQLGGLRRGGMTLADLAPHIERAFRLPRVKAVALQVNSPGGSPVQSSLIAGRIRQLAEEKGVPVYAFCEDAAASGGYWLACAADEIYADGASVVGSIGVISAGFGFVDLIEKLGVERRVHTAGERKGMLDPFRPERAGDVKHLKALQADLHRLFIDFVRTRRGARLTGDEADLFSGAFWSGERALAAGLVDGLGDMRSTLRVRYGEHVRFHLVNAPKTGLSRLFASGAHTAGDWTAGLLDAAEARAHWARLGL